MSCYGINSIMLLIKFVYYSFGIDSNEICCFILTHVGKTITILMIIFGIGASLVPTLE